jgi:hypothetical protein
MEVLITVVEENYADFPAVVLINDTRSDVD